MAVKTQGNITVTYNSNALQSYLNTQSIEAIVNEIDTTTLASTGMEKIPGPSGWTVNIGGFWAVALDNILGPDAVSPPSTLRTLAVVIGASGSTVTYTWTTNAFISNYSINASDPNGVWTWTATLAVSGVPTRS
jgi:hypothetical protein